MFENSKWITQKVKNWDLSFLFRKEFEITKDIKSAELNICMLGTGTCTINGKNVTDEVLTTPISKYDTRTYYNTYEVKDLLNNGMNAIGVHCGNSWYNDLSSTWNFDGASWRGIPKVIVEFNITYTDGETEQIVTNTSWKAFEGPMEFNHTRLGEVYDFNMLQKGFDMPGFDDSFWKRSDPTPEPGGLIIKNISEPIRVIRTIKPVSIKNNIYDFGENISGWVRIKATGEKGQQMTIKYDEALNEDGDLLGYIDKFAERTNLRMHHMNVVTFSGEGREEYAPQFCYFGFRYVKIENAPEDIEVVAEVVHTDLRKTADFSCSDEMLNKIHKASVNSTLTNFHGIPTDCPHREQNGWTGDAHLSCEQAAINFDMTKAYKKWLIDIMDAQRKSGQLPQIVPTPNYWGFSGGPTWDSALFLIPWQIYMTYGDISALELCFNSMEKYLIFMLRTIEGYICELGLGDWCSPKDQIGICPVPVLSTAYLYVDCMIFAKAAKLLGKEYKEWEETAKKVKEAWRNEYLNDEELHKSQTFLACAIYQGLLTKEEEVAFSKELNELVIKKDYHTDCGILGQKYIFDALSDYGYIETAYKMVVNPTMPSYAYWINNGMTTLCEHWSMKSSRNHHMFSEVDTWFYKHLGGLHFEKGEITVNPTYLEAVSDVEVRFNNLTVKRQGRTVTVTAKEKVYVVINGEKTALEDNSVTYKI